MKNLLKILIGVLGILVAVHVIAANFVVKELNTGPGGTFVFDPAFVHVQPGDTVTFEATDLGHNSESVFIPVGAKPWKSEISKSVTITLSQPGVYIYQCAPHNLFGMVGVIQVGAAVNKADAAKQAQAMEKKQLMNQGRISQTMSKIRIIFTTSRNRLNADSAYLSQVLIMKADCSLEVAVGLLIAPTVELSFLRADNLTMNRLPGCS